MRIQTPINSKTVKHHFTYSAWKYALMAACVILGWSLIYTVTAYRSPQNKRIDLFVQSTTASAETINAFLEPIWKQAEPEMETVSAVVMPMLDETTASMQLFTYISAAEGDIYFLNEQYFKNYAAQGIFLPLEDLAAEGRLNLKDIDVTKGYVAHVEEYDENDRPLSTSLHLYGVPLDSFYGFMNGMQVDNRGLYAVIAINNMNDDHVIPFFNALLQAGRGEKETWMTDP